MLYFDHNATTPLAPEVSEVWVRALAEVYGNASSTHRIGQLARRHLEDSRGVLADCLRASPAEIVFTAGGTESNNLALFGVTRALPGPRKHIVTTAIEHPSVLSPCRALEREEVDVSYVLPDSSGTVDPGKIAASIRPETVLVSVMHANNESGVVQPIREIGSLILARRASGQQIYFHSDGVQAFGKMELDADSSGIDLYSLSAHKIHGPKGIGALFVRKGTPLTAIQHGGRHERERRAGTENVPAAIAFACAAGLCSPAVFAGLTELRNRFEAQVLGALDDVEVNGASATRLPNTSNLLFRGIAGEAMLIALDRKGMAVSTGSACSSGAVEPSHVLLAMQRSRDEARSSVRFSFGRYNTVEEIDLLANVVIESARHLRRSRSKAAPIEEAPLVV